MMLLRRFLPRYSLRSLFLITFTALLVTQAVVAAKQRRLQRRRDVLIPDLHAQLVASQSMESIYAERFLQIVERRIDAESELLTETEEQQLLQLIAAEQVSRRLSALVRN